MRNRALGVGLMFAAAGLALIAGAPPDMVLRVAAGAGVFILLVVGLVFLLHGDDL